MTASEIIKSGIERIPPGCITLKLILQLKETAKEVIAKALIRIALPREIERFSKSKYYSDFVFRELKEVCFSEQFISERTIAFKTSAIDKWFQKNVAPAAGITKSYQHLIRLLLETDCASMKFFSPPKRKLVSLFDMRDLIKYPTKF